MRCASSNFARFSAQRHSNGEHEHIGVDEDEDAASDTSDWSPAAMAARFFHGGPSGEEAEALSGSAVDAGAAGAESAGLLSERKNDGRPDDEVADRGSETETSCG